MTSIWQHVLMTKKDLSQADIRDRRTTPPATGAPAGCRRILLIVLVGFALTVASCASADTEVSSPNRTQAASPEDTPALADVRAEWVTVKYRDTPANVAEFAELGRNDSSLVIDAWYDASNDYMVISLTGTNYHYCAFPTSAWDDLRSASSMRSHYHDHIKGNYDCRYVGTVPE